MAFGGNEPSISGRGAPPALSDLDKVNPTTGDGTIFYPSGNIAVVVCKQGSGQIITFFSDSKSSQIIASFNAQGIGFVYYPSGRPWLVVTETGYTLSDSKGNVIDRGKFPRSIPQVITLDAAPGLTVRFVSRQDIMASFQAGDCVREWQCGEAPRRTEGPYTSKVLATRLGGRLELDVGAIRQRQQAIGSVYVPPGPHHVETERPGVGSLKKALRRLDPACKLAGTVADLRALDSRLGLIDTLPRVLYGTARAASAGALLGGGGGGSASASASATASSSSSNPAVAGGGAGGAGGLTLGRSASAGGLLSSSSASGGGGGGGRGVLEDYGSPELSKAQQRLAASAARVAEQYQQRYKAKRAKLPFMRLKDFDAQVAGPGAPSDMLLVVAVLADWNPVCARVEAAVEAAHGGLAEEAAARRGSEAARIKMYKLDASEGNTLQDRYGFRTVPMFLAFYEGKLVWASNNIRTEAEMREAALGALVRGRKRTFLPEGFRFSPGGDNTLLEYIQPSTVLREL